MTEQRQNPKPNPEGAEKRRESGIIRAIPYLLLALALFVALCFVSTKTGLLGRAIGGVLLGLFSWAAYAIPLLIALHAIFFRRDLAQRRALSRLAISGAALITLSSFAHLIRYFGAEIDFSLAAFYAEGQARRGGGAIGGAVGYAIERVIGPVGLLILSVLIFILYLVFFFSKDSGVLRRLGVSLLRAAVILAQKIGEGIAALVRRIGGGRARRKERAAAQKQSELTDDDYFAAEGGMAEMKIDRLALYERQNEESAMRAPHLRDSVRADDEEEGEARATQGDLFSDHFDAERPYDAPDGQPVDAGRDEAQTGRSSAESADAFFSGDFDPLDFAANEERAHKRSSKAEAAEAQKRAGVSESIFGMKPEDAEHARMASAFERQKQRLLAMQNGAARAGQGVPPQQTPQAGESAQTGANTAESGANTTEINANANDAQTSAQIKEEAPSSAPARPVGTARTPYRNAAAFSGNLVREEDDGDRRTFVFEPEKEQPKTGLDFIEEPVDGAKIPPADNPQYAEPEVKPAYMPTFRGDIYSSAQAREERKTDEEESGRAAGEEPEEYEEFELGTGAPAPDGRESLLIHRAPLEEPDGEEADDLDEEEDEEEIFELGTPPEDIAESDRPIPPEEQNPDVARQRERFAIFDEDGAREKEPAAESAQATSSGPDEEEPKAEAAEAAEDRPDEEDEEKFPDEPEEEFPDEPAPQKAETPKKTKPDYSDYKFPPIDLLSPQKNIDDEQLKIEAQENGNKLIGTLESFNVKASIRGIDRGPRITRYEVVPASGVRVNEVTRLFNDITLNVGIEGIRMEAPIPGRSAIGFEIPNKTPQTVALRELIESEEFAEMKDKSSICIGKDVTGNPVFGDIAGMPHLLVAGATGMGKSVCINAMLVSMLYKARPDELKLILIDPKKVEFKVYNGIPHLMVPVVTDAKHAAGALAWANEEMERRYELIENLSVRNIKAYNEKVAADPSLGEPMPRVVIVVDELSDLMLKMRDPVEDLITSIAQKARAAGIHLLIGTQRPSVDVITGNIKANIPSRIACKVVSNIDSRTILNQGGAEMLLDKGDMLYNPVSRTKPIRVQGAFVSDGEVEKVMDFLRTQASDNIYDEQTIEEINRAAQRCTKKNGGESEQEDEGDEGGNVGMLNDQRFLDAVELAINSKKISTALLQRKMHIGYGKAASFIDTMVDLGVVSEPDGQKPRDVLITLDEWHEKLARVSLD